MVAWLGRGEAPLPREFRVVLVGTFVNRAGTFVEPFLILYLTSQRGYSPTAAGVVLAGYGLGAMASQIVGGWFTDHVGRRATLSGSMIATALALVALGAASDSVTITAGAFLVGLFGDMYRPAAQALVADVVSPDRRPYAFALIFWAVNLGFSVAGLSAGFLAERGYGWLFVIDAATCAGFAVVVLVGIRRDPPRVRHDPASVGPVPGYGTALRDRTFLVVIACTTAQAVAYFQSTLVLPLAVTGAGLPPSAYGIVAAANGLVIVVLQPFTARITTRLDPSRTIAVSLAIAGVGFWLTTFATSTWTFVACTLVWTLGEIGVSGHLPSLVSELADPAARGRYLGLFGFAFGLAIFLAPLLGPPLYQSHGAGWVWLACFVLFCSAAAGHLAIRTTVMRRRAQQRAAAPA